MNFYINKYPLKYSLKDGDDYKNVPEGTTFRVDGINGNMLELKPVKDIGECSPMVDASMLNIAFYETDFVPE